MTKVKKSECWPMVVTVTESRTFTAYVPARSANMAELAFATLEPANTRVSCGMSGYIDEIGENYGDLEIKVSAKPLIEDGASFCHPALIEVEDGEPRRLEFDGRPVLNDPSVWEG